MASGAGLFARLSSTRQPLCTGLLGIFKGRPALDGLHDSVFEDIEDQLLRADLGVHASQSLVSGLRRKSRQDKYTTAQQLLQGLRETMLETLGNCQHNEINSREINARPNRPRVILMVGVNGVGKTTTLAKMAKHYQDMGGKVMMAACDTFRAAAIEQLQAWGARLDIPVVAQSHGADAAAVAFDAYSAACARKVDYLLIDSAGRQHTHGDLMAQLKKIKTVLAKANPDIPHEVLITVDAGNGQNVISQVENFQKTIPLTGLCIAKLDGTARGGVVIALAEKFRLPIRYIGVGERAEDLRPFDADEFIAALLPELPGDCLPSG
ncbi:signal recognition particle-docking protein FtsY [Candidatus Spongiihabitans sp.]|uniref:signal recognition particle-docking protein FtsY n=1 Tax=Candidatus Spongiihabitans sp. TaxID=3101308 RepID=UPI003C7B5EC6